MKVKNLKTRIAAFGLAVLMGVSTLSSANAFAAEQTDVGQEVQASEQAATSQKEKAVTADDITKEISDETFAVETSMEGIHYDAEKEDVTLVSIQDEKGGEYHPDKAGTYIASYMVVPKDQLHHQPKGDPDGYGRSGTCTGQWWRKAKIRYKI